MSDRYYIDEPIIADRAALAGAEAHHLIHVMRAERGKQVTLFDGSGNEFTAVVERVGRSEVELAIIARERVDRELTFELTLAVALPKGDRQKWLVEKAVELGVTRLIPLRTCRAVADPGEQALTRLRRAVVEASKQCGRNRLMAIDAPQSWSDFVAATAERPCRLLAHPATNCDQPDILSKAERTIGVLAAIGPEGGFADDEVALAVEAGWQTVDLGPRILRIETAALAMASMVIARRM
ncbi:MAG: 16S rRNA (uracil(1498)-N(3))-methyltransferase [Thermoguttaceae bacterium]